jgi:hypothetical protein
MRLHLCGHPLAFFGKQFLNLLPVNRKSHAWLVRAYDFSRLWKSNATRTR